MKLDGAKFFHKKSLTKKMQKEKKEMKQTFLK